MKMRQFFTRRTGRDRISLRFRKHEGPYLRSEEIHYVAILKRGLGCCHEAEVDQGVGRFEGNH